MGESMLNFFRTTLNPAGYHGRNQHPPFFEGWYFKLISADNEARYAVIPGIFHAQAAGESHAFVQVLDGKTGQSTYTPYPFDAFQASKDGFHISVGPNRFSTSEISLAIDDAQRTVTGELMFRDPAPQPWPVTIFSPGIMGWYAWVPFMECYHGVVSLDHGIHGKLTVDQRSVDFTGGRGYIEKDWGRSFPSAWIWFQTNHFSQPGSSLTASIAIIPWLRSAFPGFIIGLLHDGILYRFATYTGARTESLEVNDQKIRWSVRDRHNRLELEAYRARGGLLHAPSLIGMDRRIAETLDARVRVRLSRNIHNGDWQPVFEDEGLNAGLEAVGDLNRLMRSL
jgi:tocopherol cyclase